MALNRLEIKWKVAEQLSYFLNFNGLMYYVNAY